MNKYLPYLLIGLFLITPSFAFAGFTCDGFIDCLPFRILAVAFFITEVAVLSMPFLLLVGFLGFFILKIKYPTSHTNARIFFLIIGLIGLSLALGVLTSYYETSRANKVSYNKKIQKIQQYNFQIYKLTYLPDNYRVLFYHYSDDSYDTPDTPERDNNFSVKTEITDDTGEYWLTLWQFNVEEPGSFPRCPQKISNLSLIVRNCTYLGTTQDGVSVYGEKSFDGRDLLSVLAIKNHTGFFINTIIRDFASSQELMKIYKILDGLRPISLDEMRGYSEYLFDNL